MDDLEALEALRKGEHQLANGETPANQTEEIFMKLHQKVSSWMVQTVKDDFDRDSFLEAAILHGISTACRTCLLWHGWDAGKAYMHLTVMLPDILKAEKEAWESKYKELHG